MYLNFLTNLFAYFHYIQPPCQLNTNDWKIVNNKMESIQEGVVVAYCRALSHHLPQTEKKTKHSVRQSLTQPTFEPVTCQVQFKSNII
jgi:hypothetical protein